MKETAPAGSEDESSGDNLDKENDERVADDANVTGETAATDATKSGATNGSDQDSDVTQPYGPDTEAISDGEQQPYTSGTQLPDSQFTNSPRS